MSKFQYSRDNVLSSEERNMSARKCLALLEDYTERMNAKELKSYHLSKECRIRSNSGVAQSHGYSGCAIW